VAKSSRAGFSGPKSFAAPFAFGDLPAPALDFEAGFFAAELTLFFAGFEALAEDLGDDDFFAAGFDLAVALEFFCFAELAINLGVALGLPGASGGLLKSISSGVQGEHFPVKNAEKTASTRPVYELALE